MSRRTRSTKKNAGALSGVGLLLFSLPFAGVGIGFAIYLCFQFATYNDMKSWVETPATIVSAELESHRGDDSTTYNVKARYSYVMQGKTFTGTRVSLSSGSDNVGSYHQRKAAELKQYVGSGKPFRCFVNPAAPEEAILYREMRLEMVAFMLLFALVFGGVGIGTFVAGLRGGVKKRQQSSLQATNKDERWKWKPDWAAGVIPSGNKSVLVFSIVFALFWNLISSPVLFMVPGELAKGNKAALLGLLFPLVGVGLIVWMVMEIIRVVRYGTSEFRMAALPGVIGGRLAGVIQTHVNIRPEDGFKLKLTCVRRVTTGSGKNRSTSERVLWEDTCVMQRELMEQDPTQSAIPVLFGIPYDQPESDVHDHTPCVKWRLSVSASVPGIDYKARFEVPVFKTADSSPDFVLDASAIAGFAAPRDAESLMREDGIRVMPAHGGGLDVTFPMARHLGSCIGITVFTAVWTSAIVFMIHAGAPLLFPIVFGLFDILMLWATLDLWFMTRRIVVTDRSATLSGGLFGLGITRILPVAELESIEPKRGMQSGNTQFYSIKVKTSSKTYTVGSRIRNKRQADAIADALAKVLNGE